MKLLIALLAFAAYADASAQFHVGAEIAARYDSQQRQRTEYLDIQREALDLQREALRLQREALEQQQLETLERKLLAPRPCVFNCNEFTNPYQR